MDRQSSFSSIFNAAKQERSGLSKESSSNITSNTNSEGGTWIPLSQIVPWNSQPRQYFDEEEIQSLATAFKEHGFKGAINVRPKDDAYEIVAGERRWRAAKIAGLERIRCFVDEFSDDQALDFALTENLNRSDLSKLEETIGIMQLLEVRLGLSQEEVEIIIRTEGHPDRCDVTPSQNLQGIIDLLSTFSIELQTFRTRNLRSLKLPNDVKEAHLAGDLSWSSALELNKLKDSKTRQEVLDAIIEGELSSSREVKARVKSIKTDQKLETSEGEGNSIHQRLKNTAKRVKTQEASIEAKKRKKIEELIEQIESLLKE